MTIRRTVVKGPITFGQDLTKSDDLIWHPDTAPADGSPAAITTGAEPFYVFGDASADVYTYETRDARRVLRCDAPFSGGAGRSIFHDYRIGYQFLRPGDVVSMIAYQEDAQCGIVMFDPPYTSFILVQHISIGGQVAGNGNWATVPDKDGSTIYGDPVEIDTTGWTAGWYQYWFTINESGQMYFKIHPELSPSDWVLMTPDYFLWAWWATPPVWSPYFHMTDNVNSIFDLYEIRLDRA